MRLSSLFAALIRPPAPPRIEPADPATADAPPDLVITADDAARIVRIAPGQSLGLAVHDNASIGYVWHVAILPRNLRSDGFHYPGPHSGAVGDGSRKLFRFTALGRGRAGLRLVRHFRGKAESRLDFDIRVD